MRELSKKTVETVMIMLQFIYQAFKNHCVFLNEHL
jgi:hypothetical protein